MRQFPIHLALLALLSSAGVSVRAQGETTPKADRSAEARLREVFEANGNIRTLEARIETVAREDKRGPWMPGGVTEFTYEAEKGFSISFCSSWGDQVQLRSDGHTLLTDPMDLNQGVILKDSKSTVYESDPRLAFNGDLFSPLHYFLAGTKGFDELVAKEGEIVAAPAPGGWEGIRFKSTKIGTVKIYFDPKGKHLLIHRFEFDNIDRHKELATQLAEWGYDVPPDPLDVHDITYKGVDRRLNRNAFLTTPPKGLIVRDERTKASKP